MWTISEFVYKVSCCEINILALTISWLPFICHYYKHVFCLPCSISYVIACAVFTFYFVFLVTCCGLSNQRSNYKLTQLIIRVFCIQTKIHVISLFRSLPLFIYTSNVLILTEIYHYMSDFIIFPPSTPISSSYWW